MAITNASALSRLIGAANPVQLLRQANSQPNPGILHSVFNTSAISNWVSGNLLATGSSATGTAAGSVVLSAGNWAACGQATTGALPISLANIDSSLQYYIAGLSLASLANAQLVLIFDRVSHGATNTATSATTTTNFTWANNTTDYITGGVFPFLEFAASYTTTVSTFTTTLNYTAVGGAVRTGVATVCPYPTTTTNLSNRSFFPIPMNNTDNVSDIGVTSVQSITIATNATTPFAGSANVVLYKLVGVGMTHLPGSSPNKSYLFDSFYNLEPIRTDSCLVLSQVVQSLTATVIFGDLTLVAG